MGGEDEVRVGDAQKLCVWDNDAQEFCVRENEWLVGQCRYALSGYQVPNAKESGEDLAQMVFLRCGSIDNGRWAGIENKRAYVAGVVKNAAYDFFKTNGREIASDGAALESARHTEPRTPALAEDAAILITEVMKFLSPDERQLLDMLYEGFQGDEIATHAGINDAAARKRIERLRRKLQKIITEEEFPFTSSVPGGNAQGP